MKVLPVLLVAAVVAAVVGLVSDQGWTGYVAGAVYALSLWVMLLFGQMGAGRRSAVVPPQNYAGAAAVGLVLGGVCFWLLDGAAYWAVGFILAGVLWPSVDRARRDRQPR